MTEPDFQERARAIRCLGELRALLAAETGIKVPIHDESFLIRFVRAKKYVPELALKTVKKYYGMKAKNPKVFSAAYPSFPTVKDIFEKLLLGKLKTPDKEGRPVVVISIARWTPTTQEHVHLIAAFTVLMDEILRDEESQKRGITFLCNHQGLSMEHVKEMSFKTIRTWLSIFQGKYPLRFKNLIVANENPLLEIVMKVARPFFSEKLKSRLKIIGTNYDVIHEIVPEEGLPDGFGGSLTYDEAFDTDLINRALKRDEYYRELVNYGCCDQVDSDQDDNYV